MDINKLKVSLFANHTSYSNVLKTLNEIVHLIRYDKIVAANTVSYRKTMAAMGKKQADSYIKSQLQPAFGVAVNFSGLGHSAAQACGWTRLALCDIIIHLFKAASVVYLELLVTLGRIRFLACVFALMVTDTC